MTSQTSRRSLGFLASAAAIMLLSGSVLAQDGPRRGPSDTLRGPSVNDRAMPRNERFGDSMMEGRRRDAGMMNYRVLVGTIGDLADHENPRLRLTGEQVEKLEAIRDGYQKQLRAYMEEAREQTENLRRRVQNAREEAGDDREAVEQIMERARARAQEIRANAPKTDKVEAQMWEVLSEGQQRFVKAEIEQRMDQIQRERQMERERREAGPGTDAQRPGRPGAERDRPMGPDAERPNQRREGEREWGDRDRGPGADGERGPRGPQAERPGNGRTDRADPSMRRWAQLFQRIQRLSPEQQDRLYNMINSTLERAEGAREGDRPGPRPDAERPRRPRPDAERDSDRPSDSRPERPRRGGPNGPRA